MNILQFPTNPNMSSLALNAREHWLTVPGPFFLIPPQLHPQKQVRRAIQQVL
jgi:hypothetical protein